VAKLDMVKAGHLGGYIRGGDPGTWCPHLWEWAVRRWNVRSVLDVGCGEGHSTRYFRDMGCEVLGLEGCQQAIDDSAVPGQVVRHDFQDGPFLPGRRYDLIWSCEFLEHVDEQYLPHVLATFSHAGTALLVTHAFPGKDRGHHHVNCKPTAYWIRRLEDLGFECRVDLSREARTVTLADHPRMNHFARSGLVLVRTDREAPLRQTMLAAQLKAWRINLGFRMSRGCRSHWRAYRRHKRQAANTPAA